MPDLLRPGMTNAFPTLGDLAYFDTPTQGVPTALGTAALREAIEDWETGLADWRSWEEDARACRSAVAILLGCQPEDVALVPSVVTAATTVAAQLPPGRIVVADREYRSNLLPWLAQRSFGREVALIEGDGPLTEQIIDGLDEEVSLIAVSHVQSADGERVALERITESAHRLGARVFVDATQSLGVLDVLQEAPEADFVAAAGYKWLLGGRGTGYFYVRTELQQNCQPILASPMSASDLPEGRYYGGPYVPFEDARRFDQSLAWLGWVASRPGVEMLSNIGGSSLERHALGLASHFRAGLEALGLRDRLSRSDTPSPIVAFSADDPDGLSRELLGRGVRASVRSTGVRFGFHLYNDESQVDAALEVISEHRSAA